MKIYERLTMYLKDLKEIIEPNTYVYIRVVSGFEDNTYFDKWRKVYKQVPKKWLEYKIEHIAINQEFKKPAIIIYFDE